MDDCGRVAFEFVQPVRTGFLPGVWPADGFLLGAELMTRRLDVVGFRNTVKTRFADVMEMAVD